MCCKQLSQEWCATGGLSGFMQDPTKVMPPLFSDLVGDATLWRICNSDPEVQVIVEDMRNDVARVGVCHNNMGSCKAERLTSAPSVRLLQIEPEFNTLLSLAIAAG